MFDHLDALLALEEHETMTSAAVKLRISQSAISKRIDQLETQLGKKLIEKSGRRVKLTPEGQQIVERTRPLLNEMRSIFFEEKVQKKRVIPIGISESILCSWGGKLLNSLRKKFPNFKLDIHTHNGPMVINKVRSGEYAFGICPGLINKDPQLISDELGSEPMCLIHTEKLRGRPQSPIEVLSIETNSQTWRAIKPLAIKSHIKPKRSLESFSAIARLSAQGMGPGLVPLSLANSLKIPTKLIHPLNLSRPITVVTRKSFLNHDDLAKFYTELSRLSSQLINP